MMLARRKRQNPYDTPAANTPVRLQQAKLTYCKPYDEMTFREKLAWLRELRARTAQKKQYERRYLDRRAHQGKHTQTDDIYEAHQLLLADVLMLLDELTTRLAEEA